MIKSNFKIAYRNLLKQKHYSLISIGGLAVGIAAAALIFLWINYELSYDKNYPNYRSICRIINKGNIGGQHFETCVNPSMLAQTLTEISPEVIYSTRMSNYFDLMLEYDGVYFREKRVVKADTNFFKVFNHKFIEGTSDNPFPEKNNIILTETLAKKYFGNKKALGKVLLRNGNDPLTVSAVIEDLPSNSHMHFDCILYFDEENIWNTFNWFTYILLRENFNQTNVSNSLQKIVDDHVNVNLAKVFGVTTDQFKKAGNEVKFEIQPLKSIHLGSNLQGEFETNGSKTYVLFFSTIAFFILFIACINYINLSATYYDTRIAEIGIRKTNGASQGKLIIQFLTESFIVNILAFILGFLILEIALPLFKDYLELNFSEGILKTLGFKLIVFGIVTITIGFVSGIFPAISISRHKAISLTRQKLSLPGKTLLSARSVLIIAQFAITIIVLISTFLIKKQINFINNKELGFNKEQLLVIEGANNLGNNKEVFKNELKRNSQIVNLCFSDTYPGNKFNNTRNYGIKEFSPENQYILKTIEADPDYFETYDMEIMKERNFTVDDDTVVILNERAVTYINLDDPLSNNIIFGKDKTYPIVGVVKDFNHDPLQVSLDPMLITLSKPKNFDFITIRIAEGNIKDAMNIITEKWNEFTGNKPLEYVFLDNKLQSAYNAEIKAGKIFSVFTVLSIIIACLGIYGVASFILKKRVKEIGIRKVNGARISEVMTMLNKDYIKWVAIAFIIACPIVYYAMNKWLENFAYKTNLSWWIFALAGILTMSIALLTVCWQSWRAATRNPVEALRYE